MYKRQTQRAWRTGTPGAGFASAYDTPGWRRAKAAQEFSAPERPRGPAAGSSAAFAHGDPVFHLKFGPGSVAAVEGEKVTVDFDKAGRKLVMAHFLQAGSGG